MMDLSSVSTVAYVAAGLVLPAFYVPQIQVCAKDRTGLRAYSVSKAACQIGCRFAMLPFIASFESGLMLAVVLLDLAARVIELATATRSLRLSGWTWREIGQRILSWDSAQPEPPSAVVVTAAVVVCDELE